MLRHASSMAFGGWCVLFLKTSFQKTLTTRNLWHAGRDSNPRPSGSKSPAAISPQKSTRIPLRPGSQTTPGADLSMLVQLCPGLSRSIAVTMLSSGMRAEKFTYLIG